MTTLKTKNSTFQLAAAHTIGAYILPGYHVESLSEYLNSKVKVSINTCRNIIDGLKSGKYDLGLIENPIFDDDLNYHQWIENELVFCSNTPLPSELTKEFLSNCTLICRDERSESRKLSEKFLNEFGMSHNDFKRLNEIDHATAAIQSIKWSKKNQTSPTLTIISKYAIEDEIQYERLFSSRLKNFKMLHHYYIVFPTNIVNFSIKNNIK
jgi:DNA-binding transcriptional LysR family regulator